VVLGYVLVENARYGEAIAPLVEAIIAVQELPEYAQGIRGTIVDLLRRAFTGDPTAVTTEFRTMAGQVLWRRRRQGQNDKGRRPVAWITSPAVSVLNGR
jgi:hypothetical protein